MVCNASALPLLVFFGEAQRVTVTFSLRRCFVNFSLVPTDGARRGIASPPRLKMPLERNVTDSTAGTRLHLLHKSEDKLEFFDLNFGPCGTCVRTTPVHCTKDEINVPIALSAFRDKPVHSLHSNGVAISVSCCQEKNSLSLPPLSPPTPLSLSLVVYVKIGKVRLCKQK